MTNMKCDSRNNSFSENNLINYVAGGVAGLGTYRAGRGAVSSPYFRYYIDEFKNISTNEHKAIIDAAKDVFQTSKLRANGVVIKELAESNSEQFIDETMRKIGHKPRKKLLYYLFGPNKTEKLKNTLTEVSKGNNACYLPFAKTVAINSEKRGISAFHELGHAMNHNSKGIGNTLLKSRHYGAMLVPFILAWGLLTNKKEETPFLDDKVGNFVKKNTGALMFACMVPTLLEEGIASIKGAKLAKPKLSKDLYNKMCKGYAKAWGTYAVSALAIGVCGALAVYIRDKVVENKKS